MYYYYTTNFNFINVNCLSIYIYIIIMYRQLYILYLKKKKLANHVAKDKIFIQKVSSDFTNTTKIHFIFIYFFFSFFFLFHITFHHLFLISFFLLSYFSSFRQAPPEPSPHTNSFRPTWDTWNSPPPADFTLAEKAILLSAKGENGPLHHHRFRSLFDTC